MLGNSSGALIAGHGRHGVAGERAVTRQVGHVHSLESGLTPVAGASATLVRHAGTPIVASPLSRWVLRSREPSTTPVCHLDRRETTAVVARITAQVLGVVHETPDTRLKLGRRPPGTRAGRPERPGAQAPRLRRIPCQAVPHRSMVARRRRDWEAGGPPASQTSPPHVGINVSFAPVADVPTGPRSNTCDKCEHGIVRSGRSHRTSTGAPSRGERTPPFPCKEERYWSHWKAGASSPAKLTTACRPKQAAPPRHRRDRFAPPAIARARRERDSRSSWTAAWGGAWCIQWWSIRRGRSDRGS